MELEIREDSVYVYEYGGVALSFDQVRRIQDGKLGRVTLARELDASLTPNQTARIIARIRDPETFFPGVLDKEPIPTIEGLKPEDFRPDPETVFKRSAEDYASTRRKMSARKQTRISFNSSGPVAIAWIADTHLGNKGSDVERAFREIRVVRDTPGMFPFFVGDLYDNFVIGSLKSINMGQRTTIEDQYALGQYYVSQVDDWLGFVSGNHEQWTLRVAGFDTIREIAPASALYDRDEIRFTLALGSHEWSCIARHKWQGSSIYNPFHPQTRGSKFSRPGHDVYVGAHTHPGGLAADHPAGDGRVISLIQCGTYKDDDDFARTMGFPETGRTTAVVTIFFPTGYHFSVANIDVAAYMMRELYKAPHPERTG